MPSTPTASVTRPHGTLFITLESGGTITLDTLKCCHCQAVWTVLPGSGRRRGFCTKCMGPTCGCAACDACNPFEKQLERIERGLPPILG